jgi:hypothetical protein
MEFVMDDIEKFQSVIDQKYKNHKTPNSYNSAFLFGKKNENLDNLAVEVMSGEMSAKNAINKLQNSLVRN